MQFFWIFQILNQYLIDNGGGNLIRENAEKHALSDISRKKEIAKCTQFIVNVFGPNATRIQREKVARVISEMFPFLPQVSMIFFLSQNKC